MKDNAEDECRAGLLPAESLDARVVQMRATTLDALAAHVALIDGQGTILAVNEAWRRFAHHNGLAGPDCCLGQNYLDVCERAVGESSEGARNVANNIRHLLETGQGQFQTEYPCHSPQEPRWFQLTVTPIRQDGIAGAAVMHVNVTKRVLAEQELVRTRTQFSGLVQSVDGIVWEADAKSFRFTFVSEQVERILGYTPTEWLSEVGFWEAHVHPEDREQAVRDCRVCTERGQNHTFEYRMLASNGRIIWIRDIVTYVEEAGKQGLLRGIMLDISEQRQRAEAVASEQQQRQQILDAVGEGIHGLDASGNIIFQNTVCCELLGWSPNEAAGRHSHALIHHHRPDGSAYPVKDCPIFNTLRDGKTRQVENEHFFHKDGRPVPVDYTCSPVKNKAGEITGAVVSFRDVTERQQAEAALRRSQTLLRFAGKAAQLGGWALELPERRLRWSDEICAIHDLPAGHQPTLEEAVGYYLPQYREAVVKHVEACGNTGEPFDFEMEVRTAKNRLIWVRAIGEPVRDTGGRIVGIQGAFQDISRWKEAAAKLHREESLMQMAGKIAKVAGWSVSVPDSKLYWSKQIWKLVDYPSGREPVLEEVLQYYLPESRQRLTQALSQCSSVGASFNLELELLTPTGRRMWGRVVGEADRDDKGLIRAVNGAFSDITDRKQTELQLRQAATRLEITLSSITDAFFTLDRQWCFTYLNPEAERLLRRTRQELFGRSIWDEFPQALGNKFEREYRRAMENNVTVTFEELYAPLNTWFEVRGFPSAEGLAVYFQDVNERRIAREALRESNERFRLLAKATNDAIWDWNLNDNTLWWNEGFEDLFGFQRDEIEPTIDSWYNRVHPEEKAAIIANCHAAIDGGAEGWAGEYRFLRKDGTYAFVLDRGHIIRDAEGKAVRMIGGMTDLTDRKQAEERISEQAALLDIAHEAIFVKDIDDRIIYWNKGAERIYGWSAAEAIGRRSADLLHRDRTALDASLAKLMERGEWQGEMPKLTKSGREIIVEARWTLVRDQQGRPSSVLAINADITEKKKLEERFLRAQRMESIGTLAGGIAHDLNNVLAPIMMSLEILRDKVNAAEDKALIDTVSASAERGASLVKQVLGFARGLSGERIEVNVAHQLRDLQRIIVETFPKNIRAIFRSPKDLWLVIGDPTQMHQIVTNLAVNARDAMPEGGRLDISAENVVLDEVYAGMNPDAKPGPYVAIKVLDTGTGMTAEVKDRIFEPFFTTKPFGKGTGLGLSTVLGIVKSHGGFIHVYSTPNTGTEFRVFLPAKTDAASAGLLAAKQPILQSGKGELVLVVDDEEGIREVAVKMLERFGYQVITATDGATAVALYAQNRHRIAVVITDMAMPIMDGPTTIVALKAMNPNIKIIASSGNTSDDGVSKALNTGVKHFISKPYTAQRMLDALADILGEKPKNTPT